MKSDLKGRIEVETCLESGLVGFNKWKKKENMS